MPLFNDNTSISLPHPGFASGRYYCNSIYNSNITIGFNIGFVYYTYFFVPFQQNFNRVGFNSPATFTSSQFARFAIYKITLGLPSSLIADLGEISFTSSGFKEISCSVNLSPGWYAIATQFSPNAISINYTNTILSSLIGVLNPASSPSSSLSGFRATLPYGVFPSSASLGSLTEVSSPLIFLKAT